ncbi:uncharacterized protein LOC123548477 [Mercenaria mercenaria]|uniref:uncharacterized protein LOC123548477 n=1 Tax=Mercenaria mercenaria TaxID=6596 RepID=UPI00234F0CEC|nr:uncharacterized protein LOC123548477 [Mercenaria mercenaria]
MNYLLGCFLLSVGVYGAKRYYASESCGHVLGPDQLSVIEFDEDVDYDKRAPSTEQDLQPPIELRNTVWECTIIVSGMPSTTVQRMIGIHWREFHVWDLDIETTGESVEECGKTYVTVYQGSDRSAKNKWTICGKDTTRLYFEWPGDYVTFYIYADFRRNESYSTPSTPSTTTTTTVATCVDPDSVTEGSVTQLPICTTKKGKRGKIETTTPPDLDTYPYPEVHFRVDVTSFDYACNESIPGEILKCNDSGRCLDESLMCDFFFSHNCKSEGFHEDKSDQTKDGPAYCGQKKTTTPVPTTTTEAPPVPFNWTPIAAAVGSLLAILALCWCCWRPGYLPWRLSRLRNVPFFNTQRCVCCRRGPTQCCPCLKCCAGDGSEDTYFGTIFIKIIWD